MKDRLLMVIAVLIYVAAMGQNQKSISKKQVNIINKKIKDFPEETEFAIAFIKNGEASFYGAKHADNKIVKVANSNKVFEIGSLTKVFTSTLLANLVLEDKIELNNSLQSYLDFPLSNKQITVLQLANHTSGLPKLPTNLDLEKEDQSNPYKNYSEDDLKEYLKNDLEVATDPGTTYEYSNIGAGILGYILENQTDLTYEELIKKYILDKYNMKNTTANSKNITSELVEGLDNNGNKTSNWDLNALVGAGGMLSTIEDLSKFALAQLNNENKELELTRKTTFEIPQYQMEVGLAWKILKPDPKHKWFMHNGGTGGYTSMFALDTENEIGIIILSNVSTFNENARNIDQLCLRLMQSQY